MTSGNQTPYNEQKGFTYLMVLLMLAISTVALASVAEVWSNTRQREKQIELRWVGNQFKQAIASYYHRTPGMPKRYPEKLEDLIEDPRFANPQRYLRRIYSDPVTGKPDWIPVPAPGGGIMGVRSAASDKLPRSLSGAATSGHFVYEPPISPAPGIPAR